MSRRFRVVVDLVVADELEGAHGRPVSVTAGDDELTGYFRTWARDAFQWVGIEACQAKAARVHEDGGRTAEKIDQETDDLASELEEALSYVGVAVTLEDCLTVAADLVSGGYRQP